MPVEGKQETTMRRKLRLGMVGGGPGAFIGGVHRIVSRLDGRYELVAGAMASDPARAKAGAASLGIASDRAYGTFEDMVAGEKTRSDRVDAVAIVTPNFAHHAPAKVFLEAGFHVICDKPVTTSLATAFDLAETVKRTGVIFGLTHNYTGYPMVRQAREMVAAGEVGKVRVVQVEYAQDWLSTPLELTGQKQAEWRTDPARSGPAGCLGDIGTHAYHLAAFVTGLQCREVAADISIFVPGRQLDDNVHVMLRYCDGARGML
jgi:predicted dehydrogenase